MRRGERAIASGVLALALVGCPAPRRVSGVVYEPAIITASGDRVLNKPARGVVVTWECPPGTPGPQPQTMTTDNFGAFSSKDIYADLPNACDLVVTKAAHPVFRERVGTLCERPRGDGCSDLRVTVELRATAVAPVPHGSVDPLEQAQVSKLAFGVTPL